MRLLIYGWLFFLLVNISLAEPGITEEKVEVSTFNMTRSFPWVHHGKIYSQIVNFNGRTFNIYSYQKPTGEYLFLAGIRFDELNELLKIEIDKKSEQSFLRQNFAGLLVEVAAQPGMYLLSHEERIKQYKDEERILKPYTIDPILKVIGNKWELLFNVVTRQGSIERWNAGGTLSPLVIDQFTRQVLEPNGTLKPIWPAYKKESDGKGW